MEVIVAIAIIGILSAAAYTGLSGANRGEATRAAALEIRNAVRSAQEQALTSKLNSAGKPADHYGVIVTASSYQVIRIEECSNLSQAIIISTHNLPSGVSIATSPTGLRAVTFKKNKATTQFFDTNGNVLVPNTDGSVTITVSGGVAQTIKVFKDTGRIE